MPGHLWDGCICWKSCRPLTLSTRRQILNPPLTAFLCQQKLCLPRPTSLRFPVPTQGALEIKSNQLRACLLESTIVLGTGSQGTYVQTPGRLGNQPQSSLAALLNHGA